MTSIVSISNMNFDINRINIDYIWYGSINIDFYVIIMIIRVQRLKWLAIRKFIMLFRPNPFYPTVVNRYYYVY